MNGLIEIISKWDAVMQFLFLLMFGGAFFCLAERVLYLLTVNLRGWPPTSELESSTESEEE